MRSQPLFKQWFLFIGIGVVTSALASGILLAVSNQNNATEELPAHSPTPEQVVRQNYQNICPADTSDNQNMQILGTRNWSGGQSVVYSIPCANEFGYAVLQPTAEGWQMVNVGAIGGDTPHALSQGEPSISIEEMPIKFISGGIEPGKSSFMNRLTRTLPNFNSETDIYGVYGRIFSPDVEVIEVTFDNGQTLLDTNADEDNIFALTVSGANQFCRVRALDAHNQILLEESSTSPCEAQTN